MADMLAHVEEAANEGEALKEEGNGSEDMESVQHRLVKGQCFIFMQTMYGLIIVFHLWLTQNTWLENVKSDV